MTVNGGYNGPLQTTGAMDINSNLNNDNDSKQQMSNNSNHHWMVHPVLALEGKRLNFVNGCAYQFTSDGKSLLCKVVPENHPSDPPPTEPTVPINYQS